MIRKLEIVNLDNLPEGCDIAWTMFILEAAPSMHQGVGSLVQNGDRT
jgi:hypothetical protein